MNDETRDEFHNEANALSSMSRMLSSKKSLSFVKSPQKLRIRGRKGPPSDSNRLEPLHQVRVPVRQRHRLGLFPRHDVKHSLG